MAIFNSLRLEHNSEMSLLFITLISCRWNLLKIIHDNVTCDSFNCVFLIEMRYFVLCWNLLPNDSILMYKQKSMEINGEFFLSYVYVNIGKINYYL